jgi:hypothetical protein
MPGAKPIEARTIEARTRARSLGVRVRVVSPGRVYRTRSQSHPREAYTLARTSEGWTCSCEGYAYTGCCKHLGQLVRRAEREGWQFGRIAPRPAPWSDVPTKREKAGLKTGFPLAATQRSVLAVTSRTPAWSPARASGPPETRRRRTNPTRFTSCCRSPDAASRAAAIDASTHALQRERHKPFTHEFDNNPRQRRSQHRHTPATAS